MRHRPLALLIVLSLLASCQPADIDIRVFRRGPALLVDTPYSFWAFLRSGPVKHTVASVEVFDGRDMLWKLDAKNFQESIAFPIILGRDRAGFTSTGRFTVRRGVQYGVALRGTGDGRIDFVLAGTPPRPRNITDYTLRIKAP